jgi:hypothetical protein
MDSRAFALQKEGFSIPTFAGMDVDCRDRETPRDRDRRVFGAMLQAKLG